MAVSQDTDQTTGRQEPKPQTFYEDIATGELLYFLGKDDRRGHIFQTNQESSTRVMSLDMIALRLKPVDPKDRAYAFKTEKDATLFQQYSQRVALCTEPQILDFQAGKKARDLRERAEAYEKIAHLADHLFPKP